MSNTRVILHSEQSFGHSESNRVKGCRNLITVCNSSVKLRFHQINTLYYIGNDYSILQLCIPLLMHFGRKLYIPIFHNNFAGGYAAPLFQIYQLAYIIDFSF